MSTERDVILRALQQHLLGAAEQLGRLIEVEQQRQDPQATSEVQAQVAEYNQAYWKAQTLRATKASIFDHCFHNTFPHWSAPKFVQTVRQAMGNFNELGAELLFEALQQYEQQFTQLRKEHNRATAHNLAITTVKDSLTPPAS